MKCITIIAFVLLFGTNLNKAYSQRPPDPVLEYGDLWLQGKVSLSVEDRLGNRDTVVLGLGHNNSVSVVTLPTRNVDNDYPLEINLLNSSYNNPDIRIVHSTTQLRNGAMEYFRRNYQFTYTENAEIKFDVRTPYPNTRMGDWLYGQYQPYNFKISGSNFPLVIKSISYEINSYSYAFFYAATDSNNNYYSDAWNNNIIPNSRPSWQVIDTIYSAAELSNYNLSGVFFNLIDNIKVKTLNTTSAFCTPNRVLHIPNPLSEEGEVVIYSTLGQKIVSIPLTSQSQSITLPNQVSVVVIKTQKSVWKSIY